LANFREVSKNKPPTGKSAALDDNFTKDRRQKNPVRAINTYFLATLVYGKGHRYGDQRDDLHEPFE
jgi:hypothetical protein